VNYVSDIASVLALTQLAPDIFTGPLPHDSEERVSLYGGQVAAQSLLAAGATVPDGRGPHSFHGYFLRAGQVDLPVEFHVDRDRDGRSFSARHVRAMQNGKVIFSMLSSFCTPSGPSVLDAVPEPAVPIIGPENCEKYEAVALIDAAQITKERQHLDVVLHPDLLWVRATGVFDDDKLRHAAGVVYLSDLGSGFGQVEDRRIGVGGASLDHAMWFHDDVRADEWLLLHMWPAHAVRGRGLYHGSLRTRDGRLAATLAQQNLLR
jgi:acyl-CoA thioesterase II